jgi:hypothetical protein
MNHNNYKKTIGIFGAGISGLTIAHELIHRGFSVDIYEFNTEIGGMARSRRSPEDLGMPTEMSWRGYGPFYHNVFDIMKRIPGPYNKSVFETELSEPMHFILPSDDDNQKNYHQADKWLNRLSLEDKIFIGTFMLRYLTSNKHKEEYKFINAAQYFEKHMTKLGANNFISTFGPMSGIDRQRASLYDIGLFMEFGLLPGDISPYIHPATIDSDRWVQGSLSGWSVLKQPTSESWFNPWRLYLEKLGVKFHLQHKLVRINTDDNKVTNVNISNNQNQLTTKSFDYYVMALSPFGLEDVINFSKQDLLFKDPQLKLIKPLIADGPHVQVSFFIGFAEKINWPGKRTAIVLSDSPFNITMYRQDELWHKDTNLGKDIKSLWSGTACVSYQPGILYKKTITKCSKKEFFDEIIAQIYGCEEFKSIIKEANYGKLLEFFTIKQISTWHTWKFPSPEEKIEVISTSESISKEIEVLSTSESISKEIEVLSTSESISKEIEILSTSEPKWVTSTNTKLYRPNQKTSINNLILSGAHTKTTVDIYSMEGAVESGFLSTNVILKKENQREINVHLHRSPSWLNVIQKINDTLTSF